MNQVPPAAAPQSSSQRRLLVVDDNPVNRMLAMAFAERLGWGAEELSSGALVLDRLAETSFDLVLLDISMPGLSGDEVLRQLRAVPALRQQKVVAYTAHAFPEERAQLLAAGFDGLLIKPITFQALADVLNTLVSG